MSVRFQFFTELRQELKGFTLKVRGKARLQETRIRAIAYKLRVRQGMSPLNIESGRLSARQRSLSFMRRPAK